MPPRPPCESSRADEEAPHKKKELARHPLSRRGHGGDRPGGGGTPSLPVALHPGVRAAACLTSLSTARPPSPRKALVASATLSSPSPPASARSKALRKRADSDGPSKSSALSACSRRGGNHRIARRVAPRGIEADIRRTLQAKRQPSSGRIERARTLSRVFFVDRPTPRARPPTSRPRFPRSRNALQWPVQPRLVSLDRCE